MKTIDKDRRLPKKEYEDYRRYLFEQYLICQVCDSNKPVDTHHVKYGAYKDDRTLIAVCRQCHSIAHSNKHKWEVLLLPIANKNWKDYQKKLF